MASYFSFTLMKLLLNLSYKNPHSWKISQQILHMDLCHLLLSCGFPTFPAITPLSSNWKRCFSKGQVLTQQAKVSLTYQVSTLGLGLTICLLQLSRFLALVFKWLLLLGSQPLAGLGVASSPDSTSLNCIVCVASWTLLLFLLKYFICMTY